MSQFEEYRGTPLPPHIVRQIRRLKRSGFSIRQIARASGVSIWTVHKYTTVHPIGFPHHPELNVSPAVLRGGTAGKT